MLLAEAGYDYGHVVGLFGGAGPFFGGGHEGFGDGAGRFALDVDGGLLQAADAEFFAVDIFRLDQTVTIADQQGVGRDDDRAFFVTIVFHYAQHHAAFIEMECGIFGN